MQEPGGIDVPVYTMAEAARLKGISYHTVSRAVRKGVLDTRRMGRQVLIRADALEEWRPMVERRPKKYAAREADPGVRPAMLLNSRAGAFTAGRAVERLVPVLAKLGEQALPAATLTEVAAALATGLGCEDAALIEWLPGNDGFEVRAVVGEPREWLSFQDAGPRVVTRPIRIGGKTVGLFAGIPDSDRAALTDADKELASALLTLAGVAMLWSRRG
ncbi:MAG: helix-turn-helix domain-containing protein [Chloroflexota bacterium]